MGRFAFPNRARLLGLADMTLQGLPEIAVVIQFWFADDNTIPELVIMKKDV